MSKQWGHGFYCGKNESYKESAYLISEYHLPAREGETGQEFLARECGFSDGYEYALRMPFFEYLKNRFFKMRHDGEVF